MTISQALFKIQAQNLSPSFLIILFILQYSSSRKVGKEVTIKCSHSNAGSNVKYFCKDPCKNEDILVTSKETNEDDSNGKYSIKDEGNTFTVTISDLTEDDSGAYWCGIERFGVDTYNKVVLTVKKGELIQYALHETTSYSAKEDQETDGSIVSSPSNQHHDANADHTDNIYSNITVSSEPEIQPDGLFYSTVSFNEHADFSTVLPRTATVTYSSLKHTSTDESTVYDNV
uniref:Ig-like domain-containing protein n=1 Tax=Acanthochromis polyacanthus TaxID=80966 RepID=A0A3Q1ESL0_9TELE